MRRNFACTVAIFVLGCGGQTTPDTGQTAAAGGVGAGGAAAGGVGAGGVGTGGGAAAAGGVTSAGTAGSGGTGATDQGGSGGIAGAAAGTGGNTGASGAGNGGTALADCNPPWTPGKPMSYPMGFTVFGSCAFYAKDKCAAGGVCCANLCLPGTCDSLPTPSAQMACLQEVSCTTKESCPPGGEIPYFGP